MNSQSVLSTASSSTAGRTPALPALLASISQPARLGSLAIVGALFFVGIPRLVVQDSWLALVAGREVVQHGLPSVDHLVLMSQGRHWVDQQWLAQAALYEADVVGGIKGVLFVHITACLIGFGCPIWIAYRRGASFATVTVIAVAAVAAAPWALQLRTQGLAIGLFGLTLALLLSDPKARSLRTLVVIPLLCLWANIHGSVALGAILVMLYGLVALLRNDGPSTTARVLRNGIFVLAPPLAIFASPYAGSLVGYYRLMLISPPFAGYNVEWERTVPSPLTAVFFALVAVVAVTVVARRTRFSILDVLMLLVTLASALAAVRGIVWFALAALAIVPPALTTSRPARIRISPFVAGAAALGAVAVMTVAFVTFLAAPSSQYDGQYAASAAKVVARFAGTNGSVFADDQHADWLLWRVPALRGRVAYDVRFELLTTQQIKELSNYLHFRGAEWTKVAAGYRVVVGDWKHVSRLARLRGMAIVYRDKKTAVAVEFAR